MKALIVANWKMNPPTLREAKRLHETTRKAAASAKGVSLVICPPSIFLRDLASRGRVGYGVQNVHFEPRGSYTGEISAVQAKDAKAQYVIVGHAERRALGESNDDVRKKVDAVLFAGMTPILCVGEQTRSMGAEHFDFVREQLRTALSDESAKRLAKIVIAYEPVWAIGAPKAMEPRQMHEMGIFVRKTLVERCGGAGHDVKILYGGAVDAGNAAMMLREGDVAGFLVGRASVDREGFASLLKAVANA